MTIRAIDTVYRPAGLMVKASVSDSSSQLEIPGSTPGLVVLFVPLRDHRNVLRTSFQHRLQRRRELTREEQFTYDRLDSVSLHDARCAA